MKSYRRKDYSNEISKIFHKYIVNFLVNNANQTHRMSFDASSIEDAIVQFDEQVKLVFPNHKVIDIISISCDGKLFPKDIVDKVAKYTVFECDGAGDAGGDAGGATGGDAGAADAGDTAGEMTGTSTADVLGTFDPKKGVMGVGNFMVPAKVKVPLHRWEVCNGGSKRKKDKKGRPMKTPYEKGMKVVVSMFEDDGEMPVEPLEPIEQNTSGMWEYYEENVNTNDLEDYVHANTMTVPKLKAQLQTSSIDLADAVTFDPDEDAGNAFYGFKKYFKTRQDAVQFALKRIHDERLAWEDDNLTYAGEWTEDDKAYYDNQYETACKEIQSRGYASFDDGRNEVWHCEVNKVK